MNTFSIANIAGVSVGHAQNLKAATGCTVILCQQGATAAVDVRGGGPATRETDLLRPENLVQKINAVVLSGGSAFGLDAAGGVMHYLDDIDAGFDTGVAFVPIVCGASLFDLGIGSAKTRPDAAMGLEACRNAISAGIVEEGNVGAGCGATVGKLCGFKRSMKSGLGTFGVDVDGIQVCAITAVNALGTVVDKDGTPLAGVLASDGSRILSPEESYLEFAKDKGMPLSTNTTISCVVTNAILSKAQATKVASMAHDAYAHAIRPVHTSNDGDTIFVMSTCEEEAPLDFVGILAVEVLETAIRRAVLKAQGAHGHKAACDLK